MQLGQMGAGKPESICMLLKPAQKITGVGGNQAGINTRLVPFFSSSSYSVSVDL